MKVKELKQVLNNTYHSERHDDIVIRLAEPSIGPIAMCGIKSVVFGFDWEKGKTILYPQIDLVKLKENESLW
ncbi:MAG TPA: hypothetical protein PKD85_23815 [Saprospiraceae bacterium]|mgnify:CR=1 FL=1|nr:hypothetical protein [Saprospiraceae bacterium]